MPLSQLQKKNHETYERVLPLVCKLKSYHTKLFHQSLLVLNPNYHKVITSYLFQIKHNFLKNESQFTKHEVKLQNKINKTEIPTKFTSKNTHIIS